MHYLLDKLDGSVKYKNKKSKAHKSAIANMQLLKGKMLDFESAVGFVYWHQNVTMQPN